MLALINDILDFSKIEAGKIELDPIEFLFRDALADTLNPLALRASSKGLELTYEVHADVPDALVADVHRLLQVVVNLVGNAIKFTERGEIVVYVRIIERTGDALVLEVAVRDTALHQPRPSQAVPRSDRTSPHHARQVWAVREWGWQSLATGRTDGRATPR